MAAYNEILVGRINRFLQKFLAMKGGAPAPQLAADVQPGFVLPIGIETRYLESWDRFSQIMIAAAVAANGSAVQIRNPTGSNVIAVIEKLQITQTLVSGAAEDRLTMGAQTIDLTTVQSPTRSSLDPRQQRARASCIGSVVTTVPGVAGDLSVGLARMSIAANTNYDYIIDSDQQLPLLPGEAITYVAGVVNQRVAWNLQWRERFLEDSERA
jgi:hypothetical protein